MTPREALIADAVRIHHIASYWYAHGRNDALARDPRSDLRQSGDPDRFGEQQGRAAREFHEGRTSYLPSIQDVWRDHVIDEIDPSTSLEDLLDLEDHLNA